jgi:hypothetical protein
MTLFYAASFLGKERYEKYYQMVLTAIKAAKVKLIAPDPNCAREVYYDEVHRGMEKADAAVVEISQEDFLLGREITLAVQNKKPVLALSVYEDFSAKITSPYFFGAKYSERNIEEIIADFIHRAQNRQYSVRFNLFLSPAQEMYLERAGRVSGLNKSEYLRMLIDKDRG